MQRAMAYRLRIAAQTANMGLLLVKNERSGAIGVPFKRA
jgi:hypothetical protein